MKTPINGWAVEITDSAAIVQEYFQGKPMPHSRHVLPLGKIGEMARPWQIQKVLREAEELCNRLNLELNQSLTKSNVMIRVVVKKRSDDFHASIFGRAEWGCGRTPSEAIGELVSAHPALFGIEVEHEKDSRKSDVRGD
jgi:hypothetical protein